MCIGAESKCYELFSAFGLAYLSNMDTRSIFASRWIWKAFWKRTWRCCLCGSSDSSEVLQCEDTVSINFSCWISSPPMPVATVDAYHGRRSTLEERERVGENKIEMDRMVSICQHWAISNVFHMGGQRVFVGTRKYQI